MEKGKIELTQKDAENTPAGGVVVGKRDGQTMIYDDASLGGYFVGKLHKDGGIKMINKSTGQPLEVQGSEIIITAPAVNDQTKREFEGKMMTNREILSKINSDGGGVSFADGGDIPAKIHTTDCEYKFGGKVVKDTDIAHSLGMNSTLKKGKQQFSSGDTTYDVDAIYNAIKKGKLRLKTKEVETFPMKYPVYDKKYSETVKTDFRKPNGITVLTESGEEVLIDGNHRMNNAYLKGKKTMKTYYIEDPKQISKFSKKNKFELGGENKVGGHLSSGKSLKQIAEMHNVSLAHINEQLAKGLEVEKEHFADFKERTRVAKDHLVENPNYYTILEKAGLKDGGHLKHHHRQKEDLVKDAKSGNTPARDLNNYNDLMDVEADGQVGGNSGIYANGGEVKDIEPYFESFSINGLSGVDYAIKSQVNFDNLKNKLESAKRGIENKYVGYDKFPFHDFVKRYDYFTKIDFYYSNQDHKAEIDSLVEKLKKDGYTVLTKTYSFTKGASQGFNKNNKAINVFAFKLKSFANGGEVNDDLWQSVKDKFSKIFWEEDDGDEIYANEVKAEERVWIFDRYSPYMGRFSWEDAKNMFLKSLTDEEKKIVNIEYNLREVSEAFGLMWQKKILVKRKKKIEEVDDLSELLEMVKSGSYANGGITPYDANLEGDSVPVLDDKFAKGGVVYDTTKPKIEKVTIKETKFNRASVIGRNASTVSELQQIVSDYIGTSPKEDYDWIKFYVNDSTRGSYYIDLNKGKKNTVKNVNPETLNSVNFKRVIDAKDYLVKNYDWTDFFELGSKTTATSSKGTTHNKVKSLIFRWKESGMPTQEKLVESTEELYNLLKEAYGLNLEDISVQPLGYQLAIKPKPFLSDGIKKMVLDYSSDLAIKNINRYLYELFPDLNFEKLVGNSSNSTKVLNRADFEYIKIKLGGNKDLALKVVKKLEEIGFTDTQDINEILSDDGLPFSIKTLSNYVGNLDNEYYFNKDKNKEIFPQDLGIDVKTLGVAPITSNASFSAKPLSISKTKVWLGEDYKQNLELSKKIQEKAFELGWGWFLNGKDKKLKDDIQPQAFYFNDKNEMTYSSEISGREYFDKNEDKELTAEEILSIPTPTLSQSTTTTNYEDTVESVIINYKKSNVYLVYNVEKLLDEIKRFWKEGGRSEMEITLQPQNVNGLLDNTFYLTLDNVSNGIFTIDPDNISLSELKDKLLHFYALDWDKFFGVPASTVVNQGSNLAPYEASTVTLTWINQYGTEQTSYFYTDDGIGGSGESFISALKGIEKNSNGKDVEVTIRAYAKDNDGNDFEKNDYFTIGENFFKPSTRTNEQIKSVTEEWIDGVNFDKFFEDVIPLGGGQASVSTALSKDDLKETRIWIGDDVELRDKVIDKLTEIGIPIDSSVGNKDYSEDVYIIIYPKDFVVWKGIKKEYDLIDGYKEIFPSDLGIGLSSSQAPANTKKEVKTVEIFVGLGNEIFCENAVEFYDALMEFENKFQGKDVSATIYVEGKNSSTNTDFNEEAKIMIGENYFQPSELGSVDNLKNVAENWFNKQVSFNNFFNTVSAQAPATQNQPFDFSDTKIWIGDNPELSKRVQEKAFENGYKWNGLDRYVQNTERKDLYFNGAGKTVNFGGNDRNVFDKTTYFREITEQDIFGFNKPNVKYKPIDLSQTKIWIGKDVEVNKQVQERAFELGWSWKNYSDPSKPHFSYEPALYFHTDKDISYGNDRQLFDSNNLFREITINDLFEKIQSNLSAQMPTVSGSSGSVQEIKDLKEAVGVLEGIASQASQKYNTKKYEENLELLNQVKEEYSLALSFTPESSFMYERIELMKKIAEIQKEITTITELKKGGAYYILSKVIDRLEKGENWKELGNGEIMINEVPQQEIDTVIHTDKFKNWFGNWEEALVTKEYDYVSKALTENGMPCIMYHGAKRIKYSYRQVSNGVVYLAENRSYAEWFSANESPFQKQGDFLTQCFVNIKNPIDLTPFGVEEVDLRDIIQYIDALYPLAKIYDVLNPLIAKEIMDNNLVGANVRAWNIIRQYPDLNTHIRENTNYDGFIYYENNPSDKIFNEQTGQLEDRITKATAVFKSSQVKLVDAMLFDGSLDDWRFEKGGKVN